MKIICDGLDLSDAVLKVSKALSVKSANPVLEGIKITAVGDTLTLLATDTELTIEKKIRADILMEGETVVVGKYFVDFVKKLEKEKIELTFINEGGLQIKYGDSTSQFQVFPVANFPVIEKNYDGNYFELSQRDFKSIATKTCFACSTDDSRPILKGCLYEVENGELTSVALDGFRMSVVKKSVVSNGDFRVVIPSRTLSEINKLLDDNDETIKIILNNNVLFVELNNTTLISRLIEGEFVKYKHILPTGFENYVTVSKDMLLQSIERASIVAKNDRFNIVKFDIKENLLTISAKSEVGTVNENVPINLQGKDMVIAFNGKYILDFLRLINDEFICISLKSQSDPCIIKPVGDEDLLYLVMSVRINV